VLTWIKANADESLQNLAMQSGDDRPLITIVEGDTPLLRALEFACDAEGWRVAAFTSATELLRDPPATDCLLVDHKLPGADGLALILELRQLGLTAPAILIASRLDEAKRRAAAESDVVIVEKPLVGGELRLRIEAALSRS